MIVLVDRSGGGAIKRWMEESNFKSATSGGICKASGFFLLPFLQRPLEPTDSKRPHLKSCQLIESKGVISPSLSLSLFLFARLHNGPSIIRPFEPKITSWTEPAGGHVARRLLRDNDNGDRNNFMVIKLQGIASVAYCREASSLEWSRKLGNDICLLLLSSRQQRGGGEFR